MVPKYKYYFEIAPTIQEWFMIMAGVYSIEEVGLDIINQALERLTPTEQEAFLMLEKRSYRYVH